LHHQRLQQLQHCQLQVDHSKDMHPAMLRLLLLRCPLCLALTALLLCSGLDGLQENQQHLPAPMLLQLLEPYAQRHERVSLLRLPPLLQQQGCQQHQQ
jgi:hypothetical protein